MTRARKLCSDPHCPELQPCPQHQRKPWEGSTRRARLPPDWNRRRHIILNRDRICQMCGIAPSVEVDHIVPGDNHALTNLQGLCKADHAKKTRAEAAAARTRHP